MFRNSFYERHWTDYPTDATCSMLNFPENERDSRKLKKIQELVQHFQEQCRYFLPKQNITYSIDESLRSNNYETKKRREKKKNCGFYISETNLYKMWYGLMQCVGQCWKNAIYVKKTYG